jgi:hypothetical protein
MARFAAITVLFVQGTLLFVGLPFLIFVGGWGGADSGGILHGMLLVAGLPVFVFGTCATAAILLIRATRPGVALCIAATPTLAATSLWILPRL